AQSASQRFVDEILEARIAAAPQAFKLHGHVVVNRQCRSHASNHKHFDALMQRYSDPEAPIDVCLTRIVIGRAKSPFEVFRRLNLNPESGKPNIGELRGGQQPDRGNAEVFEDLRAEADLAPL